LLFSVSRTLTVRPGSWLYKDPAVRVETVVDRLTSGFFGGKNFIVT
jgi:hypothetical protein